MKGSIESVTGEAFAYVTSLSIDALFLGGLFLLLLAYGLRGSQRSLVSLILAVYAAILLAPLFPYTDIISVGERVVLERFDLMSLVIYASFILLAYIAMRRVMEYELEATRFGKLYQTGLLAFFATGLLALGAFKTSLIEGFQVLTPVDIFFTTPEYAFWWIFASLVAIFITTR